MISYHCDSNAIIDTPFNYCADKHILLAYGDIMQRLKDRKILVDLQIFDNKASTEYKSIIKSEWGLRYQLVLPLTHFINEYEHAIRTFKANFLSILAGIANTFPNNLWDLLPPQTDLTLNLLRHSTLNPNISGWEYLQGTFEYKVTPLGTLGFPFMVYWKTSNRKSWEFRSK